MLTDGHVELGVTKITMMGIGIPRIMYKTVLGGRYPLTATPGMPFALDITELRYAAEGILVE